LLTTSLLLATLGVHGKGSDAATRPDIKGLVPRGFEPVSIARSGVRPVSIASDAAEFDAEIEVVHIVDGVMENPSGPGYVSWYEESAELGEVGNALFAAHVDWHTTGAALFYNLRNLVEGDEILVTGEDGATYSYLVSWLETVEVESVSAERMQELLGRTDRECITLLTCGGEFDYDTGHYLARTIVRAERDYRR
jgi:sortase (surface protein transpeptidase)